MTLAPYEEFAAAGKTYYFTPGGFLYRKDPGTEELCNDGKSYPEGP